MKNILIGIIIGLILSVVITEGAGYLGTRYFIACIPGVKQILRTKISPQFKHLSEKELEIMQQNVDEGYEGWRSDPTESAAYFVGSHYPDLDFGKAKDLPAELGLEGNIAIVTVVYDNKKHTVHLHKAFPSNPKSIWIVDIMYIE